MSAQRFPSHLRAWARIYKRS